MRRLIMSRLTRINAVFHSVLSFYWYPDLEQWFWLIQREKCLLQKIRDERVNVQEIFLLRLANLIYKLVLIHSFFFFFFFFFFFVVFYRICKSLEKYYFLNLNSGSINLFLTYKNAEKDYANVYLPESPFAEAHMDTEHTRSMTAFSANLSIVFFFFFFFFFFYFLTGFGFPLSCPLNVGRLKLRCSSASWRSHRVEVVVFFCFFFFRKFKCCFYNTIYFSLYLSTDSSFSIFFTYVSSK